MTALSEAIDCAYRGWPVVPLHWPESPGVCSCRRHDCGSVGKHPLTPHGLKDASIEFAAVRAWFRRWPDANYAICTGRVAGLTVLDVDGPDGAAQLSALEAAHGALPATATVTTGRGRHLYWRWVEGSTNRTRVRPGLDVRSDGGYVVGPGSLHASGETYEWAPMVKAVDAPSWLVLAVAPRREPPRELTRRQWDEPRRRPADLVRTMPLTGEGGRNWALYRFACRSVRLDGGAAITAQLVMEANRTRCSPPLPDSEVEKILSSAERHRASSGIWQRARASDNATQKVCQ